MWQCATLLHCYCVTLLVWHNVQLCQSSSLVGGSQDASSSHVIQPFSLLIFMLYMLYNPLQPTIHVLNVKQPFSRLIVVVPVTGVSNGKQHFHLSICWCFGWVWQMESEQIQVTIWWWDEQACLGVVVTGHRIVTSAHRWLSPCLKYQMLIPPHEPQWRYMARSVRQSLVDQIIRDSPMYIFGQSLSIIVQNTLSLVG